MKKAHLHRKVATTIVFESNGGQQKGVASVPEIRLAVGVPGVDLDSVHQCLEALNEACYFLHADKGGYQYGFKANLNKLLADRRASVPAPKIDEQVKTAIRDEFVKGSGIERIYFPEKTSDIPDRAALVLAVMGPDRAIREPGTLTLLETMVREHGQSSRVFKSAVLFSAAEDSGIIRDEARKLLAWEDILGDKEDLKLEDPEVKQIKEHVNKSKSYLREAIWQAYKNVALLDENNALHKIDLGKIHSSAAPSIVELILGQLRGIDLLSHSISVSTLLRNWPPALPEWSTKALRDAFYASPKLTRLSSPDVVKNTIARGVTEGHLAYAGKRGDHYEPFVFRKTLSASEIEIRDDILVLRKEDAEQVTQAIEAGKPPKPPTVPPPPPGGEKGGELGDEKRPSSRPPPSGQSVPSFRWEGAVPWQKWTQFYNKVVSRFSTKGLKLRVVVEVAPRAGSPSKISRRPGLRSKSSVLLTRSKLVTQRDEKKHPTRLSVEQEIIEAIPAYYLMSLCPPLAVELAFARRAAMLPHRT